MDHRIAALGLVVAQHYRLLRQKVQESKDRGTVQLLTDEEAKLADYLGDTIEGMAGKAIGEYCRGQFQRGWLTVDLRAYKIKFVLTKLRDLLPPGKTKDELTANLEAYVGPAEALAGCTADAKRRNKAAREEQAKLVRQHKEERAALRAQGKKVARKSTRARKTEESSQLEFDGLLAEVDSSSSPQAEEPVVRPVKVVVKAPETASKPRRAKKTREERAAEKAKKLESEILSREYGEASEEDEERSDKPSREDEEDYGKEDRESLRDDLCSHYERGFSSTCRYGDAGLLDGTGGEYEYDPNND